MQPLITNSSIETNAKYRMQKMQVLFVGDNPFIAPHDRFGEIEFSRATLDETISKISEKQIIIDAVVADAALGMPQIKMLRGASGKRNLPLLLYSLSFDQKIKDVATRLGVDDYFWDSMPYTCATRLKFIISLKKFRIQWLSYERTGQHSKNEALIIQFFERVADILVSTFALLLLFPVILFIPLAKEIEFIEHHIFSNANNSTLANRIFNWYEFLVLVMFSPIFLIIKTILKILSNEEPLFIDWTHPSYINDKRRKTMLDEFLSKTRISKWPHLIKVLKGEGSLLGRTIASSDISH